MQKTKSLTGRVQVKDATKGEVEVVFATLGVKDHDGDIILPGAIKDGAEIDISGYGHSVWKGDRPVGIGTIHEVGDELVMKGRYFMDVDDARNDFYTVKGLADAGRGEWSFGLVDIVATKGTHNGVSGNLISSVEVPEVSPVWKGAGINTRTLAAKGQKQYASSLASLLRSAGRERWDREEVGGWVYVWVEDYDIDANTVVFNIESHDGHRMVQVDFDRTDTAVTLGDEETEVHETVQFLPKSFTFSEHLSSVVADVKALADRAEEVVALRAAKGKTISDDASGALSDIGEQLERIKALVEQPTPPNDSDDATDCLVINGEVLVVVGD